MLLCVCGPLALETRGDDLGHLVSVCSIISVECVYALLHIKSSNDGPLYRRPETIVDNECSLQLYGVMSNGAWIETVTQEHSFTNAYYHPDCRVSL